jgi:diketogulonate reductase-like aldo/keto reductase
MERESDMFSFAGVSRRGASAAGESPPRTSLTSVLTWDLRYSPLPKSSQPHRVKSNADIYDFSLADEDMSAIEGLDEGDNGALSWNPIHTL